MSAASLSPVLSATLASGRTTDRAEIERSIDAVRAKATEFARLTPIEKAHLLRSLVPRVREVARGWVDAGCLAKGISPGTARAGEEWLAGPVATIRNVGLLIDSLNEIATQGRPRLGASARTRPDGRVAVEIYPDTRLDAVMFSGFTAYELMQEGWDLDKVRGKQASFYHRRQPEGGVTVVLGAGNVSSIPPMDVFYKMFVDGNVCILKMNPVNEWVGPFLERALEPLISRDYLRIVYGGGDVGAFLCESPHVDDVHITGSDRTHDLIVWGPEGADRTRRLQENDPKLKKTITSELGNVSPVAIVPADYSDAELWFQARNLVSMVVNNGSFNCNAAKILITAKGWPQRDVFMSMVARALASAPTRKAYYPGAFDRYRQLTEGQSRVERYGEATDEKLPWTIIRDVDASDPNQKLFRIEPFCGLLSHVEISSTDPAAFISDLTSFANDRLWGTLNAAIVIHPRHEKDRTIGAQLDKAIVDLRYGTVAINHWPAVCYGLVSPAWGGHPSATLKDIQSGLGWVHNTFMLEGIDKTVVRGNLVAKPKPAWFFDNKRTHLIGERMVEFFQQPSWLKLPGIVVQALRG